MKRLIGLTFVLLAVAAPASAQSVRERLGAANQAMNAKNYPQALEIYTAMTADTKVPRDDRITAWSRIIDIHRTTKKWDDAVAAAKQLLELQQDDARRKLVMLQIADLHAQATQTDAAIAVLKDLAAKYPDDDDNFVQANLTAANYLVRAKQHAAAVEYFDAAAKRMDEDDPRRLDAVISASTALWDSEQFEKSIEIAKTLTDPKYRSHPRLKDRQANDRVIGGLVKLKRQPEAVALLKQWEQNDPDPALRPRWCLSAARNAAWSGDPEGALESYKRLIVAHASVPTSEGWFEAQNAIADGLIRQKDLPGALKACHILFDAAPDQGAITMVVTKMADLLTKIDGNNKRAKALVNYQLFGVAGKDGKTGTADDETNPMPEIGYPDDAGRAAAFAKAFAEAGDDAAAIFHRGQLCVYSGHPDAAATLYLQAARQSGLEQWPTYISAAVMNGWRPVNGTGLGMEAAVKYFTSNAEGDDPFKPLKLAPAPWPIPTPTDAQKQQLADARRSLWQIAEDATLPPGVRQSALRGLARISEAAPLDELDRCIALTHDADGGVRDLAVQLALKCARGDSASLAPVGAFVTADRLPANAAKKADADYKRIARTMDKFASPKMGVPKMTPPK